jgi:hypothetical protein
MFTSLLLPRPSATIIKGYVFSAKVRMTEGDRARDLQSHNPLNPVAGRRSMLRKPLI